MAVSLTANANPGTAVWSTTSAVIAASGQATILNGQTSVVVSVGVALNGARAIVSFGEAPTAAALVYSTDVASGNLTISIDVDNTANLKVNYIVFAAA